MKHDTRLDELDSLSDWQLEHSEQDIRNRPLRDANGQKLGIIDDLLVDKSGERVAAVRLEDGRACAVENIEIFDDYVVFYPEGAAATARTAHKNVDHDNAERIREVTEEVAIGKRAVEGDTIHVRSRVVTDDVSENVRLRDEHVDVKRRDVNVAVTGAEADKLFQDRTIEVTEVDEEAVVAKTAKVTGEVVVSKDVDEKVEHVTETVRRTEVDVDRDAKNTRRT